MIPNTETELSNLKELLTVYAGELKHNHQNEEAHKVINLLVDWKNTFVKVFFHYHSRKTKDFQQNNPFGE